MSFETFEQFHEFCCVNSHLIYVREQVNQKWDTYSLKELGNEKIHEWAIRWWSLNQVPILFTEKKVYDE